MQVTPGNTYISKYFLFLKGTTDCKKNYPAPQTNTSDPNDGNGTWEDYYTDSVISGKFMIITHF